ncbi:MarR family transcriptional regulator [Anaerobacillus alkaliphilus]|uniref:MarR family transcriptional regulator n=1 Tax=Anaerobacillus alkaliphilus TaxID=1548597 RepID=A0A4Q0VNR0_9BACI|nr:MarR family transcriptional regulator [Anaerobacillus alkaliphilus]RXI96656.1 MarR family transcriptional regulator [Anaerobacillus alkaliphilus]
MSVSSNELLSKSYLVYAMIRGLNFVIENDIKNQLNHEELTFPGFRNLWILYFHPNIRMTELTYLAQVNISNIFRQLTKLKEDGLVIMKNGNDARTREVSLTKEGKKIVQNFIKEHANESRLQVVQTIKKISDDDLNAFIKVASFLSTELIGSQFYEFVVRSSNEILETSL